MFVIELLKKDFLKINNVHTHVLLITYIYIINYVLYLINYVCTE